MFKPETIDAFRQVYSEKREALEYMRTFGAPLERAMAKMIFSAVERELVLMAIYFNSLEAAFAYYTTHKKMAHLLRGPKAKVKNPGKAPVCGNWAERTQTHALGYIHQHLSSKDYNLGANCGKPSYLIVIDIDLHIKGMQDYIFGRIDTTGLVRGDI